MLIIVLHNNKAYLETLAELARRDNIIDTAIIEKSDIGIRLFGGQGDFIFHHGMLSAAYKSAIIAVVKGEKKSKRFFEIIKANTDLERLNIDNKGFICSIPFQRIKDLELKASLSNEEKK